MELRLITLDDREVVGRLMRVTKTRVQVRAPDGLLHMCNRATGKPLGGKGCYKIPPEELLRIAESGIPEEFHKHRYDHGVASHWDV